MTRRGLEGEIQRLNMILTDKETEIQVHQERCETLIKQIQVKTKIKVFYKYQYIHFCSFRIVKKNVSHYN